MTGSCADRNQQAIKPSLSDISAFLPMMFGCVDFEDEHRGCVVLRGVGESGTDKSGKPFGNVALRGDQSMEALVDAVYSVCQRWGENNVGSFIVPAVMDVSCLEHGAKCGDDKVRFFTTLLIDIDKGYPSSRIRHAAQHIGPPSMIVASGGTTTEGQPKLHAYWKLKEPSPDVAGIAAARKKLALKLGADLSFGRVSQVIRIPGSVYAKDNAKKLCTILKPREC